MTKREKGKIKVGSFYKKMEEQGVRVRHRQRKRERNEERKKEKNKAVYTASSVACFWAGAVIRLYTLLRALAVSLLIASSAEKALSY